MKLTFDKENFLETLSLASRFTSSKISSISSLQGVLLKGNGKGIDVVSTNLNSFFRTSIKGDAGDALNIVVEPRKILEFLSYLPQGKVDVDIEEKKITLAKDKTRGVFPLFDVGDFPLPPRIGKEKKQKIKTDFLKKNLPLVIFAASPDETRPSLTGVNFVSQDEDLYIVATDGFRLSLIKTKNKVNFPSMLIPREFLEEVLRYIKDEDEVEMGFLDKEKVVYFKVSDAEFYTRLIEGEFPPYEKVIPDDKKTTIVADRETFLQSVKLASVFARDFSNIVILEFKKDGLYVRPKTDDEGENKAFQEVEFDGEEQRIAFNFKFVSDFLTNVEDKKVVVEVLRPDAPCAFRLEGNKEFLHIIMPVRIQE